MRRTRSAGSLPPHARQARSERRRNARRGARRPSVPESDPASDERQRRRRGGRLRDRVRHPQRAGQRSACDRDASRLSIPGAQHARCQGTDDRPEEHRSHVSHNHVGQHVPCHASIAARSAPGSGTRGKCCRRARRVYVVADASAAGWPGIGATSRGITPFSTIYPLAQNMIR